MGPVRGFKGNQSGLVAFEFNFFRKGDKILSLKRDEEAFLVPNRCQYEAHAQNHLCGI